MKRIFLINICLFSILFPVLAQHADGKKLLDNMSDAFRKAGGVQAEFTVQVHSNGSMDGSSAGVIRLKGEKFQLDAEGVKTWFDGRTQWSYIVGSDEVNISEPTPEELQSINPYSLLSIYKQGYNISMGKAIFYAGKSAHEVILTAQDKKRDLQRVVLYIAKDSFQPLCISLAQRGGSKITIGIKSYKTGMAYDDSLFVFDKKAYPTAEVIDLR